MSKRLETVFAGAAFKNPVALASGTCGFGREFNEYFDIQKLGGLCSKGLTLHPCLGNDGIRVWETASGVMNSVGMENPGIQHFIDCDLERMNALDLVNIVNMGGHSEEDYLEGVELLNQHNLSKGELTVNSMPVMDSEKQRKKMASEFYAAVRKEIALYQEKVEDLITSDSRSCAIMYRWVSKIDALEQKKQEYEVVLRQNLDQLDDEFTTLRMFSQELSRRAKQCELEKAA